MNSSTRHALSALAVCCAAVPLAHAGERPTTKNLPLTVLPLMRDLESNKIGSMTVIGDSISYRNNSYHWFLRERFWADYGSAGDGFISPVNMNASCDPAVTGARCGIGITRNQSTAVASGSGPRDTFGRLSLDGQYLRIFNNQQANGEANLFVYGKIVNLFYIEQSSAGKFDVDLNGDLIAQIDSRIFDGGPRLAELTFPTGQSDPDTTSRITLAARSGTPSQFTGVEMISGDPGFIYHRLARGGAGPRDFLRGATDASGQILPRLDLDLIGVMLDWAPNERPTYMEEMNEYLDWLESFVPDVPKVLISHHPFIPTMRQQSDMLLEIATDRGYGYINLADTFQNYDEMDALGYMEDVVHFTAAGGEWFGDYIYNLIQQAGQLALTADVTGDNILNFFDIAEYLNRFQAGDTRADINEDGTNDFFDVQLYLSAFEKAQR